MTTLPSAMTHVRLADFVAVSRAGHLLAGGCPRLAFLTPDIDRLSTPLFAHRGTLVHRAYELALGRRPAQFDSAGEPRSVAERAFDFAVTMFDGELEASPSSRHLAPLSQTSRNDTWHAFRARNIHALSGYLSSTARGAAATPRTDGQPPSIATMVAGRSYAEVSIASDSLRIRGTMDAVRLDGEGILHIHDHKSGNVLDEDGELKRGYALQLALYGEAAKQAGGKKVKDVRLTLAGRDTEESVDRKLSAELLVEFRDAVARHASGTTVPADDVTVVGPSCAMCPVRHQCSRYLAEVPTKRASPDAIDYEFPLDVWGEVTNITSRGSRRTIDIRDGAGYRRTVLGVTDRHVSLENVRTGDRIALFGLERNRGAREPGFTRNMFEYSQSQDDRAWTVDSFRID